MSLDLLRKISTYNHDFDNPSWEEILTEINAEIEQADKAAEQRGYSGGWQMEDAIKEHAFSLELAYEIWRLIENENSTVYDIGAGPGFYSRFLSQRCMHVQAFDVMPNYYLQLYPVQSADVSKHLGWIGRSDVVLCLEVGEHIEAEHEATVLNNICNSAKNKIILSWAIPGQGGFGHVNCQPNDYIIEQMEWLGWAYNEQQSTHLRGHCSACSWFENTLMVFDRKK